MPKGTERAEKFPMEQENMETEDEKDEENETQKDVHQEAWQPSFYIKVDKEIHFYAGHEITIWQSLDSSDATIWPAALALCQYLDINRGAVNLLDKAVLEIGAGAGLVSIVASLLGAWVTASDLPDVVGNLKSNLSRNTRSRCRYTPQVVEISWGDNLKKIFPRSVYRYDYVLAADVVYHHDLFAELLVTMCHFCQPGTTLIWANKIRFASDLAFLVNFKKAFNSTLLADMGDVKIYSATTKEFKMNFSVMSEKDAEEREENIDEKLRELPSGKKQDQDPAKTTLKIKKEDKGLVTCASVKENPIANRNDQEQKLKGNIKGTEEMNNKNCEVEAKDEDKRLALKSETEEGTELHDSESTAQSVIQRRWAPCNYYRLDKEIHSFMGHTITIQECIDSYGGMIWPAAVALCKFLETVAGQEMIDLFDKETLELGAGTGLLSVVAILLGAKLTATDLPELLGNLRCNLNRNTRGHRRHEPQVAALSWGHELEQTFPQSQYHYDYVLAADVVYHHDFLNELLVTMKYFCQPGTNVIWANKVRYPSDLVFIENFEKTFHATLIAELDEVRIYSATHRVLDDEDDLMKSTNQEEEMEEEDRNERTRNATQRNNWNDQERQEHNEAQEGSEEKTNFADEQIKAGGKTLNEKDSNISSIKEDIAVDTIKRKNEAMEIQEKEEDETQVPQKEENEKQQLQKEEDEQANDTEEKESEGGGKYKESQECIESKSSSCTDTEERSDDEDSTVTKGQTAYQSTWKPNLYYMPGKEIHYFLGQKIIIEESIDSYGAVIWPAAVALCKFLETPAGQQQINLLDKSVMEIGAGTGILSVVVTLLGAKLTATDLPEILSNLRYNLNRNTRSLRRHEPQVKELAWGHKLKETFPHSTYHYDYVLAADVVYHHGFLDELLVTMQHFCQPGTNVIWANKVRYPSDLIFIENFKKTFHATLIAELDEVRIYKGKHKSSVESNVVHMEEVKGVEEEEKGKEGKKEDVRIKKNEAWEEAQKYVMVEQEAQKDHLGEHQDCGGLQPSAGEPGKLETDRELSVHHLSKETHFFVGHKISIEDSSDFHEGQTRTGALGLCRFLDTAAGRQKNKLLDKSVLELGAGTGLVSIVATLLGAQLIATDLPEILGTLRYNLNRNTRHCQRYEPQVVPLLWGHELDQTFPHPEYQYDFVLAADVVCHHDFLDELLVTMCYFCHLGTTLIWASEICYLSDLVFTENFTKAFHTTLLAEMDEVKIYSATIKERGNGKDPEVPKEAIEKPNWMDSDEEAHEEKLDEPVSMNNEMKVKHEGDVMKNHKGKMKVEGLSEKTEMKNDCDENRKGNSFAEFQKNMSEQKCHMEKEMRDEKYEEETRDEELNSFWTQSGAELNGDIKTESLR